MKKIICILMLIIGSLTYSFGKEEGNRSIKVIGESILNVAPDTLEIKISFSEIKPTYEEAVKSSEKTLNFIQNKLKDKGIKKDQIKTTYFNVDSYYENVKNENGNYENKFLGYRYTHKIYVDLDIKDKKAGEVLKVFNNLKIENVDVALVYKLKNDKDIKNKLMVGAFENAQEKAKILAKAGNFDIAEIQEIEYISKGDGKEVEPLGRGVKLYQINGNMNIQPDDLQMKDKVMVIWRIK